MKEFWLSPKGLVLLYLLIITLVTFFVFGWDKLCAKRDKRRVPEGTLFLLALLGGSIGALLGMRVFHHKTLHKSFTIGIPLILILQVIVPLGLYVYFNFVR